MPFPSILVASHNDHYMGLREARRLSRIWGSNFADAGHAGHINADSGLGDWHFGQFLLGQLIRHSQDEARAGQHTSRVVPRQSVAHTPASATTPFF